MLPEPQTLIQFELLLQGEGFRCLKVLALFPFHVTGVCAWSIFIDVFFTSWSKAVITMTIYLWVYVEIALLAGLLLYKCSGAALDKCKLLNLYLLILIYFVPKPQMPSVD